jgi:hypothetical protein
VICLLCLKKTKLCGLSLQANYTDWATAACRRSYCQLLRVDGVVWSAQRIPTAVNLGFLDRSRYFFIQVAPQLSSWGWVDPVRDPLLLRKSGRPGNRTRDLWICSQKIWPLDHCDVLLCTTLWLLWGNTFFPSLFFSWDLRFPWHQMWRSLCAGMWCHVFYQNWLEHQIHIWFNLVQSNSLPFPVWATIAQLI